MILKNERLLAAFREGGHCEVCGKWNLVREPHHVVCRGMGGGSRMDHPWNLLAVGSSFLFVCLCHQQAHSGKMPKEELVGRIAKREGVQPHHVLEFYRRMKSWPKMTRSEVECRWAQADGEEREYLEVLLRGMA